MKLIKNKPLFFQNSHPNIRYADGSEVVHQNLESQSQLSNEIFVMALWNDGKEFLYKSRPIRFQNQVYIAPLPNPIHLLLNIAIENYNYSVQTLDLFKDDCQLEENNKDIYLMNLYSGNVNHNFNNVIKFKITAIISLITAMEAFLNQAIPDDFIYIQENKVNGKIRKLNKKQIEGPSVTFKEKLTDVIAQFIEKPHFAKQHIKTIKIIEELYNVRREVIHMKTNSENWMNLYFDITGSVIDIDLEKSIVAIKKYMNIVQPKFLK